MNVESFTSLSNSACMNMEFFTRLGNYGSMTEDQKITKNVQTVSSSRTG